MINIAIIGCADIAIRRSLPAINALSKKFNITSILSRDINKARSLAKIYHCEALEGYQNVFNIDNLDAVYLPLPTGLHKDWIPKLLKKGIHIYSEKAIALNKQDATEFVDLAQNNGLALMEGYMFQYHNQHQKIKELIEDRRIGKLRFFSSWFGFPLSNKKNFRLDQQLGGGILSDVAGYPLKATQMYLGNDISILGSSLYKPKDKEIEIAGSALLQNKEMVTSSISFSYQSSYQNRYELWGSEGYIKLEKAFTPGVNEIPNILLKTENSSEMIKADKEDHFISSFNEFYEIIKDKTKREKHYEDIVNVRSLLDEIRVKSL